VIEGTWSASALDCQQKPRVVHCPMIGIAQSVDKQSFPQLISDLLLWTKFGEKLEDVVVHQGNGLARMGENKWLPFL
jgi:hypothetical protein